MHVVVLLVGFAVLALTAGGAVALVVLLLGARPGSAPASTDPAPPPVSVPAAFAAARRHAAATTALAWTALLLAPWPVLLLARSTAGPRAGVLIGLTPAVAGVALLAVHAGGELTWPRPTGTVRRALLAPRRVRDLAPRALRTLTWTLGGALLLLLAVTGATGDGGSITVVHSDAYTSAAGPYPGPRYALPLAAATLLVIAGTEAVLRLVARRPAVADTSTEDDHRLRRASSARVLAGAQLVLGLTLAGVLTTAGHAARTAAQPGLAGSLPDPFTPALQAVAACGTVGVVLGTLLVPTSLVVTAWTLARSTVAAPTAARPTDQDLADATRAA